MKKWPYNPLNEIISWLKSLDLKGLTVADMGCGEALIAEALAGLTTVFSYDLVALNERVTACNMSEVHLRSREVS